MKQLAAKSTNSSLIWLVTLMLVLHVSTGNSGSGSLAPFRSLKQSELTLTAADLKSDKKTHFFLTSITKHATSFTGDFSFYTRIFHHTQSAELEWKILRKHHLLTSQIRIVHVKLAQNDDDDLSILNG